MKKKFYRLRRFLRIMDSIHDEISPTINARREAEHLLFTVGRNKWDKFEEVILEPAKSDHYGLMVSVL